MYEEACKRDLDEKTHGCTNATDKEIDKLFH